MRLVKLKDTYHKTYMINPDQVQSVSGFEDGESCSIRFAGQSDVIIPMNLKTVVDMLQTNAKVTVFNGGKNEK